MRLLILLVLHATALCGAARAAEITKAECEALHAENRGLISAGVPKLMEKGPDWAKANLPPEQLSQIKRLLHVSEQITFRCETIRPINAKVDQSGEADGTDSIDDPAPPAAAPVERAATAPADAARPKPKPAPKPGNEAKPAPKPKVAGTAKPEAAPKTPQPKANDAFVPAARQSSTLDDQAARQPQ
jgi:hypothetical protein